MNFPLLWAFQNSAIKCLERTLGSPSKVLSKLVSRLIKFYACLNANDHIPDITVSSDMQWCHASGGFSAGTRLSSPRRAAALDHLSKGRTLTAPESQVFTQVPELVRCMLIRPEQETTAVYPAAHRGSHHQAGARGLHIHAPGAMGGRCLLPAGQVLKTPARSTFLLLPTRTFCCSSPAFLLPQRFARRRMFLSKKKTRMHQRGLCKRNDRHLWVL